MGVDLRPPLPVLLFLSLLYLRSPLPVSLLALARLFHRRRRRRRLPNWESPLQRTAGPKRRTFLSLLLLLLLELLLLLLLLGLLLLELLLLLLHPPHRNIEVLHNNTIGSLQAQQLYV